MGAWGRLGRASKAGLLLAAGAAGGAAAVAVASVPGSDGVIHACYQVTPGSTVPVATTGANLRIIDPAAGQTCNTGGAAGPGNEVPIAWNQQGPPGQQGPQGPQGPPGKSVTIAGGNTLTIGGTVVTVGASSGVTINVPSVGAHPIGSAAVTGLGVFDILSVSLGSSSSAGRAGIHDIVVTKTVDKSSTALQLACFTGQHFKTVTLYVRKSGGVYLQYRLDKVLVSSFQLSGHGGTKPTETLTFNYNSIAISYTKRHH
jgi:hypothetical protein